jgi:hypothetical protein
MTIGAAPMCIECKHYIEGGDEPGFRCEAFPDGIPDEIFEGGFNHRKPYKGDNGIRFEPIPKAPNERKSA